MDLNAQIEKFKNERKKYEKLVLSHLNDSDLPAERKKKLELQNLAAFFISMEYSMDSSIDHIEILETREEPDFLISLQGKKIGLELTQIFTAKNQRSGTLSSILNEAAKIFKGKYEGKRILANIDFAENLTFSKQQAVQMSNEICDVVFEFLSNPSVELPAYLTHLSTMPHSDVSFDLSGSVWVPDLALSSINEIVKSKNRKLETYRKKIDVGQMWLVTFVSGASSSSIYKELVKDEDLTESAFDQLFFMDVFAKKVINLNSL